MCDLRASDSTYSTCSPGKQDGEGDDHAPRAAVQTQRVNRRKCLEQRQARKRSCFVFVIISPSRVNMRKETQRWGGRQLGMGVLKPNADSSQLPIFRPKSLPRAWGWQGCGVRGLGQRTGGVVWLWEGTRNRQDIVLREPCPSTCWERGLAVEGGDGQCAWESGPTAVARAGGTTAPASPAPLQPQPFGRHL